jgi:MATE family multidrug resistance protein
MLVAQYFIIRVFELGPRVAWLAFVALIFAIAVVFVSRLRGDRWRDEKVLEMVMVE